MADDLSYMHGSVAAYSDSGYLSEPARAPTLVQSSADDGSHASERPRRAHRCRGGGGGVNAAADRLTEELAETANAINTLGTSSARSSLVAKTVTITSGRVARLSEASAKRQRPREAARLQPTCHPGSRARPLRSRSSGFGFDSDICDSEGEREREGLESTGVQLVQVPSPSTGKIRTRVRPTAEVPQTAATTIGTIGLPSFMQESESAPRPIRILSPPPEWLASRLTGSNARTRDAAATGKLASVTPLDQGFPQVDAPSSLAPPDPYPSAQPMLHDYQYRRPELVSSYADPLFDDAPYDADESGLLSSSSPLPFSVPGRPTSPTGSLARFSPPRTSTPIYESQLLRNVHGLETPIRPSGAIVTNAYAAPRIAHTAPAAAPMLSLAPPIATEPDTLPRPPWQHPLAWTANQAAHPLVSHVGATHHAPAKYTPAFELDPATKHQLAKARRAAKLEEAAAECMPPFSPLLGRAIASTEIPTRFASLADGPVWSERPTPSPPVRFPTPSDDATVEGENDWAAGGVSPSPPERRAGPAWPRQAVPALRSFDPAPANENPDPTSATRASLVEPQHDGFADAAGSQTQDNNAADSARLLAPAFGSNSELTPCGHEAQHIGDVRDNTKGGAVQECRSPPDSGAGFVIYEDENGEGPSSGRM